MQADSIFIKEVMSSHNWRLESLLLHLSIALRKLLVTADKTLFLFSVLTVCICGANLVPNGWCENILSPLGVKCPKLCVYSSIEIYVHTKRVTCIHSLSIRCIKPHIRYVCFHASFPRASQSSWNFIHKLSDHPHQYRKVFVLKYIKSYIYLLFTYGSLSLKLS